jgi:preprotein translocase subunit SecG
MFTDFRRWNCVHTFLVVLLVLVCIALIVCVLLQSGKSAGLSGAISGGAEQLFGKQKARGIDLVLHRATIVLSVLFFVLTIAITYFEL